MAAIEVTEREFIETVGSMPVKKPTVAKTTMTPVLGLIVSGISLASGVLGGFVGAISTASQWKGEISTRIEQLEKLRIEDKIDLKEKYEYLRAQQEVTGRDVSTIKAVVTETNRRRQ